MGADPGLDCSHLCHNTLCCNPDHLVLELRSINNDRNHYKNEMHCFGHGKVPDLRLVHNINVCMPSLPSSFVPKGEQILFSPVGSKFFQ